MKRIRGFALALVLVFAAASLAMAGAPRETGATAGDFPSQARTEGDLRLEWFLPYPGEDVPNEDSYIAMQILKNTGIQLIPVMPAAEAEERLNVMLAGKAYPDIIEFPGVLLQKAYIDAGAIYDLTEAIPTHAPNLMANLGVLFDRLKQEDGRVYHIPGWFRADGKEEFPEHWASFYSRGRPLLDMGRNPDTFDEIEDLLKFVDANYDDVIPMMLPLAEEGYESYLFQTLGGATGIIHEDGGPLTRLDDGSLDFIVRVPEFRVALKRVNEWYRAGLISEESATMNIENLASRIDAGDVHVTLWSWGPGPEDLRPGLEARGEPDDVMLTMYPRFDDSVTQTTYITNAINYPTGQGITLNNADPFRTMKFVNFMNSREGLMTLLGKVGNCDCDGFDHFINEKGEVYPSDWLSAEFDRNENYWYEVGLWFYGGFGPDTSNWITAPDVNMLMMEFDVSNWWSDVEKEIYPSLGFEGVDYWPQERTVAVDVTEFTGLPIDPSTDAGLINIDISDHLSKELPKLVLAESASEFDAVYDNMVRTIEGYGLDELLAHYENELKKRMIAWGK